MQGFKKFFWSTVQHFASGYYALIMATGIISLGFQSLGIAWLATLLFIINIVLFIILTTIFILRFIYFPQDCMNDFKDHSNGPGYIAFIPALSLLGGQFLTIIHQPTMALIFFFLACFFWIPLIWGQVTILFVSDTKPAMEKGINGGWHLFTVACQAIVILGCGIAPHISWNNEIFHFFLVSLFGLGFILYLYIDTILFLRLAFQPLTPAEANPNYWVNAGAMAISGLAVSHIILLENTASPFLLGIMPFLKGLAVILWATATWWIPILILLALWKYYYKKYPFTYTPAFWSMVFPLGTYGVCTFTLAHALKLDFLLIIPPYFLWAALGAWLIVFLSLFKKIKAEI